MNWLNRLFKNQKGVFLVFTAVLLPIIFACAGLAMDLGNAFAHKSKLQNAADAAALAGAHVYYTDINSVRPNAEAYQKINYPYNAGKINNIEVWGLNGDVSKGALLTVCASDEVETTFMKLFGYNIVPISVKATCKVTPKPPNGGVFDYAFIGGNNAKLDKNQTWNTDNLAMKFDVENTRIKGKVHSNGSIFISDNVNDYSERYVLIDQGCFSTSVATDDELWANRRNNVNQDEHDKGTPRDPAILHQYDLKIGPNSYRYFKRMGYDDNGQTKWGIDVVAPGSQMLPQATEKEMNISMAENNPMTSYIYQFVETKKKEKEKETLSSDVYVNTDGNYSAPDSLYTGWDKGFNDWRPYKVIIVDGNISISKNHIDKKNFPMVLISLHGNIQITELGIDDGFKALLYAPNGNVTYNIQDSSPNAKHFEGSIVAKRIFANSKGMTYTWNDFGFDSDGVHSSGSGGSSGGSGSSTGTSGTESVVLYPEDYTSYSKVADL